jgi:hypothetical protein
METLIQIVEKITLVIQEIHLFHAVIHWGIERMDEQMIKYRGLQADQIKLRQIIEPAFKCIRFELMSIREFCDVTREYLDLFGKEEVCLIFQKITLKLEENVNCVKTNLEKTKIELDQVNGRRSSHYNYCDDCGQENYYCMCTSMSLGHINGSKIYPSFSSLQDDVLVLAKQFTNQYKL